MASYPASHLVRKRFREFHVRNQYSECFGLLEEGSSPEIIPFAVCSQGKDHGQREGWRMESLWIKKLDKWELEFVPPKRFRNSVSLNLGYSGVSGCFPDPLGLIYKGNPLDLLKDATEGYFVTNFVEGPTLLSKIQSLSERSKEAIFRLIGFRLKDLVGSGAYLLDFAPRDIVLADYNSTDNIGIPIFVDTEHVEFGHYNDRSMRDKQRNQFREDYKHFSTSDELSRLEKFIFPN